ncbi:MULTISPECIES: hypothetical protein [Natronobacterium]|uniref:hypothetical protein n=1 Tax=Natronobacterium TaxID=2256 RepID=UPI0011605000|nr:MULTISPECIES: hypothetical protein [Halobiforma]
MSNPYMPFRRQVISVAVVLIGGLAGCTEFSNQDTLGIVDQVDIDNNTNEEYTATVRIHNDETVYNEETHIPPNIREGVEIPPHEPGTYTVEVTIEELTTTREMNISEHISEEEPCISPIFRIEPESTMFSDSHTYSEC